nr:thiamine pyrophosphate-dependent enzyme [Cryobacterium psychrophilum]
MLHLIAGYGVRTIFGIPGTHNLEFYRHLDRLGIHAVTARHEQGAGYAADAWGKRSRLPGVVIATSGPGLLNVLSAAGTAYCESRPMIVLAPGAPLGSEKAELGNLHETKDQIQAAGGVFDVAHRVTSAKEALDAVHDAFARFSLTRPRPIYIEVPLNLLEAKVDASFAMEAPREITPVPMPAAEQLSEVADLLARAKRPLIIAGGGSIDAGEQLQSVAERLSSPVFSTLNGKGVLPESHPLSLGAELRLEASLDYVRDADVLLVLGSKLGVAERRGRGIEANGKVIRVDILDSQRDRNLRSDYALIGDTPAILAAIDCELKQREIQSEPQNSDAMRKRFAAEAAEFDPISDALSARIVSALPHGVMVSGDSSQIFFNGVGSRLQLEEPCAFMYMATYCTLGYALPAAIGAKIADPRRPSVAIVGDGALMFSVQELQTATEQGLDITVICVDNGGYGEIRQNEIDRKIVPVAVNLSQPNWPLVAEAFGGKGFAVKSEDQLEQTIRDAIAAPGVTLVHVPVNLFGAAQPLAVSNSRK